MTEHVIFEQYTDMDKNINTLARIKAECLHSLKYSQCSGNCNSCLRNHKFQECYRQLALCDQLRLDSDAEYFAARMSLTKEYLIKHKKNKFTVRIAIIIIAMLLIIFINTKAHGQSIYTDYYDEDEWIVDILEQTHERVKDINEDGLVNCIDYSITFKKLWDLKYPRNCCEIIRNFNVYTGWHHLFISVRGTERARWLFIEPQGTRYNYRMEDYWKDKFNATYNVYYETSMWLARSKL